MSWQLKFTIHQPTRTWQLVISSNGSWEHHNPKDNLTMVYMFFQRAEDETARLYAEFVESFQGDSGPGSKAFVRGGTIDPNDKLKESEG